MRPSKSLSHLGTTPHGLFSIKKSSSFELKKDIASLRIALQKALKDAGFSVKMSAENKTVTIEIPKEQHVKTNQGDIQNYMEQYNEERTNSGKSELGLPLFKNRKFIFHIEDFLKEDFTVADIKDFAHFIHSGKHLETTPAETLYTALLDVLNDSIFGEYIEEGINEERIQLKLPLKSEEQNLPELLLKKLNFHSKLYGKASGSIFYLEGVNDPVQDKVTVSLGDTQEGEQVACFDITGFASAQGITVDDIKALAKRLPKPEPARNLRASI